MGEQIKEFAHLEELHVLVRTYSPRLPDIQHLFCLPRLTTGPVWGTHVSRLGIFLLEWMGSETRLEHTFGPLRRAHLPMLREIVLKIDLQESLDCDYLLQLQSELANPEVTIGRDILDMTRKLRAVEVVDNGLVTRKDVEDIVGFLCDMRVFDDSIVVNLSWVQRI